MGVLLFASSVPPPAESEAGEVLVAVDPVDVGAPVNADGMVCVNGLHASGIGAGAAVAAPEVMLEGLIELSV